MAAAEEIISNKLRKLAKERNDNHLVFSNEGWRELLHAEGYDGTNCFLKIPCSIFVLNSERKVLRKYGKLMERARNDDA